ncbi:MAG: hypothetical protein ACI9EF_001774 [Pseudohongiellaceae bacterium]|jgi:hypothetical protein
MSIHQIREMFAALSLPICNDEQAIQAAADARRSARNRDLNSTKGTMAVRAQTWFEQVDALLKKREQLLDAAYQDFVSLGDAVLGAAGFGGKRKIAKSGRTALLGLAQTWCGAREDLAHFWVDRFMSERKLGTRPVGVGTRQKFTSSQSLTAPAKSPPTQPAQARPKKQAPVASSSNIALAPPLTKQAVQKSAAPTASGKPAQTQSAPKAGGSKAGGSKRAVAVTLSALAVAAIFGAASQGLISLDVFGTQAASAQAGTDGAGDDLSAGTPAESVSLTVEAQLVTSAGEIRSPVQQQLNGTSTQDLEAPEATQASKASLPPWTAWAIEPDDIAFSGQTLKLRLECDSLPDGRLHNLRLQGLKVNSIELTESHTELQFDVMDLPDGHYEGQASWSFTLKNEDGQASQRIQGHCQVLLPAR